MIRTFSLRFFPSSRPRLFLSSHRTFLSRPFLRFPDGPKAPRCEEPKGQPEDFNPYGPNSEPYDITRGPVSSTANPNAHPAVSEEKKPITQKVAEKAEEIKRAVEETAKEIIETTKKMTSAVPEPIRETISHKAADIKSAIKETPVASAVQSSAASLKAAVSSAAHAVGGQVAPMAEQTKQKLRSSLNDLMTRAETAVPNEETEKLEDEARRGGLADVAREKKQADKEKNKRETPACPVAASGTGFNEDIDRDDEEEISHVRRRLPLNEADEEEENSPIPCPEIYIKETHEESFTIRVAGEDLREVEASDDEERMPTIDEAIDSNGVRIAVRLDEALKEGQAGGSDMEEKMARDPSIMQEDKKNNTGTQEVS